METLEATTGAQVDLSDQIERMENELMEMKGKLAELRRQLPPETVEDYVLTDTNGNQARLSELFGDRSELIFVHNMGKRCSYCTLWADGFIGFTKHLEDRAAFVLASPDDYDTLRRFARDRGWTFRCCSTKGSTIKRDLGFETEKGEYWPGVNIFRKDESGRIWNVNKATFGPGDEFCGIWGFMDLLPGGADGWEPQYYYDKRPSTNG